MNKYVHCLPLSAVNKNWYNTHTTI